jgi:hypothetical protein
MIRPAYITCTWSQRPATTPRSWVTKMTAIPSSRWSLDQLQDLGLHGHVEGRRGLVGDQELRAGDERHRDHHPLAHAARELVGIEVDPPPRR